jgi:Nuclear pore protein 84 / 107
MMLNETDSLLILVEEKLRIARSTMSRGQYAQFVRFFSHYILFKRLVDDSEQNSGKEMTAAQLAANAILRAYVELLDEAGQDDELVALYASSLDTQNAIDSYAQYLRCESPCRDSDWVTSDARHALDFQHWTSTSTSRRDDKHFFVHRNMISTCH